jgi:hypothetical protein
VAQPGSAPALGAGGRRFESGRPDLKLKADVTFYFRSESLRTAGADVRRLADAAAEVGFDITGARIEEAPPEQRRQGTSYVPLDGPRTVGEG